MRWLSLLAGCVAVCLLIVAGRAGAQNPLGAPSITQVFVGTNHIDVFWSAPADNGGSTIIAYDLRYIRSDAPDKTVDANWTVKDAWVTGGGTLVYELKDLPDGTKYDLQVRADNGSDGPWSTPIYEATTTDHSDSRSSATALSLGSSVRGSIDPADDEDYFRVALATDGDLWVYTTGSDDTVGVVVSTRGIILAGGDDGQLLDGPLNFSIREELPTGTYYVRVTSFDALETASYTIHAQLATDPGSTKDTATTVSLDSITPGRIGPEGGIGGDKDYFKLELSAAADVWVIAVGDLDTVGQLLDADEMVLEEDDDSEYFNNETGFLVRRELGVGTYYIRVRSYVSDDVGPYTLFVRTATDPGSSTTTATPITLGTPETGRIRPSSDQDYFSLTLDEDTYVYMYGLSFGGALPLTATVTDSSDTVLDDLHVVAHEHWAHNGLPEASFSVWGKLDAGTYSIRVQAPSGGTGGPYLLHALESLYGRTVDRCTGITTAQSDPWYGCAWHLNNTMQFPGGAGRDINVEEVWATTMGAGINIAVVDDGLQYAHEDLALNVITARNHDYYGSDIYDPLETHGTRVAGIIAARDNDIGVRGVAPRASIYGYNLIDINDTEALDEADAMTRHMGDTAVNSNSWGPIEVLGTAYAAWGDAIADGVTMGFGGKGVFYVFAAGNGFIGGEEGNLDEYANHYGVAAVCAVNYNDVRASYSETGSHLWVCAPSGDGRLDLPGIATTRNGDRYTDSFSGTSAAAPIVSGVAALVRATNTDLTWRDVKLILAASARKNDSGDRGSGTPYRGWESGALQYGSTSQRYQFNHQYGFGVVDAGAAVALADGWTKAPELREIEVESGDLDLALPEARSFGSGTAVTTTLTVDSWVGFIEFVEINATFDHPSFRDLKLELVSPTGARSLLTRAVERTLHLSDGTTEKETAALTSRFRFGSARHLGEDAAGTWTLRITDLVPADAGTLKSWSLKIYGHGFTPSAPTVTMTAVNRALAVEWSPPADTGGSDITAYDVRYISADATNKNAWTERRNVWRTGGGDLRYVIRNLTNDEEYDVQVRAVNDSGRGRWSESVDGKPEEGNVEPKFPGVETGERSVDENTLAGRNVGAPVAARDDDNNALTYTLSGNAASVFDIVEGTGQLRTREPLNREGTDTYTGTVAVTDGKNMAGEADPTIDDTMFVTITVGDVDEAPEIMGDSVIDIAEGGTNFVGFYSATDPEGEAVGLTLEGTDRSHFEFDNGVLRFLEVPDYEARTAYGVQVKATDGTNTSTLNVTVNVENVEERGSVALPSQPQERTGFTASLTDPDGRISGLTWAWERSPNGVSSWSSIDGATSSTYTPTTGDVGQYLRATASYTDGHGSGKSAEATSDSAVRAAPVANQAPEFPSTETGRRSVIENTTSGVPIGSPVEAIDDDVDDTLTYTLDGTGATFFEIDEGSGQLSTKATLDREQRSSYRVTVTARDPSRASDSIGVTITIDDVDEAPTLSGDSVFSLRENSTFVGRYTAMDPERAAITWSMTGLDDSRFSITNGTLAFLAAPDYETPGDVGGDNEYEVTVTAADPAGNRDSIDVTVRVTDVDETRPPPPPPPITSFAGFGGGASSGPEPSDEDFYWTVDRDIEELDSGNDRASGVWSDGTTLWVADNADGTGDAVYAYDRESGERVEDREFALDKTNLAPRGFWADRGVVWVSDSGRERLFAYDVESGERVEEREFELTRRNSAARGIWSDGVTMWVLDDRNDALFAYDLDSGGLIAEYELDSGNSRPEGVWSDRFTIWVSDHDAKRLFAYRLPTREQAEDVDEDDAGELERVSDEDFRRLSRASNNSPRGIWSDGLVMYVADESDDKVYTYNMPEAIDARLESLTLSGVDFGEFSPGRTEYTGVAAEGATETTVEAKAVQDDATVAIELSRAGADTDGRQAAASGGVTVIVTVTSADGSRTRTYRVTIGDPADCMVGLTESRFNSVTYEGGSVPDLEACAVQLGVEALYALIDERYVSLIVGAPEFVNRSFAERFPEGVPAGASMIAKRSLPEPDPAPE